MKPAAIALTTVLALIAGTAWSQPPQMIAYQGLITDDTGAPVADGTYSLTFRIIDAETGGAELWSETQPDVAVSGGLFGVTLGSVTPIGLDFTEPYWLETQIESGQPQFPRIRLTSVPYSYTAMNADHVDGYDADATPTANTLLPLDATGQFPEGAIPSAAPSGAAGGDLTGTYPNPSIADDVVTGPKIQAGAVNTSDLAADAITGPKIQTGAVHTSDIAADAVTSAKIQDGEVKTGDMEDDAVTAAKIAPDVISSIDGVYSDGGNIDLIAGSNVSITPDDGANTITIAASGGGDGDITSVWPGDATLTGGGDDGDVTLSVANPLDMSGSSDGVIVGRHTGGNTGWLGRNLEGVYGYCAGSGAAVKGYYTGGSTGYLGTSNDGVYGESAVNVGSGVVGVNTGDGYGVYGVTASDDANGKAGVWGAQTGSGTAVRGYKTGATGVAVRGTNYGDTGSGTSGFSTNYCGLWGESDLDSGIYGRTGRTDNNYGLQTPDNLYSLNFHTAGAVMHLARNGGADFVEPGDVVVFSGAAAPLESGGPPVAEVSRAPSANSRAVAGIVYSRFNVEAVRGEAEQETGQGSKAHLEVTPEGAVSPGEYLLLVVQGPAQVKTSALTEGIRPGDLLSSAPELGYAARAADVTVGTVKTAVPGTVVAKALEPLEAGQGLIYAFVTLQ